MRGAIKLYQKAFDCKWIFGLLQRRRQSGLDVSEEEKNSRLPFGGLYRRTAFHDGDELKFKQKKYDNFLTITFDTKEE
jgi:hypothetical protein